MTAGVAACPAGELLQAYPELRERVDAICERPPWCVTGVSALLADDHHLYLEIVKPRHWVKRAGGAAAVGLGAIGGSLEPGEPALAGLAREVREEVGCGIRVSSAPLTHVVYEGRAMPPLALPLRDHPRPALLTVSRNAHRQTALADWPTLAIATFRARPDGPLDLGDLYGLLAVPRPLLEHLLAQDEIAVADALRLPGVRLMARRPLPERSVLTPVWTVRSLRDLARAGLYDGLVWTSDVEPA